MALLFGAGITNAVDVSAPGVDEEAFDFDIPALPLRRAAQSFAKQIGSETSIGQGAFEACKDFVLEPLIGRFTAREAWRRLTAPICAASGTVTERPGEAPVYLLDHPWVVERKIHIPRAPLINALAELSHQFDDLPLEYWAVNADEGERIVGPIAGTMGPEEALGRMEAQLRSGLRHRRDGAYALVLESRITKDQSFTRLYPYGRQCSCPVRVKPVVGETVIVEKPAIVGAEGGSVARYSRQQIESTGASTLPQFFRYVAINGITRPEGYIASGAQYADFRGLGRDTHLVTINGRRTLPSANNVTSSAFDLNTIPLPAIDHVDFRLNSATMRTGSDAIAGTIDIVTRREFDGAVQLRYGTAEGGARERRATASFGHQTETGGAAVLLDHLELGGLLGAQRPLSRDQNYTPKGGLDFRNALAIRSTDGANLPGMQTALAGWPDTRQSEVLSIAELTPNEPQRVSLSRYQSLVPAGTRTSAVGALDYTWRGVQFAGDLLWVKRDNAFQYYPAIASGTANALLPGSPFHAPVRVDVLLTGAPSMEQHVDSDLLRVVGSAGGEMGVWNWDLAMVNSSETATAWVDHMLDAAGTQAALDATQEDLALDVFAMRPGGVGAPGTIWAMPIKQRFSSSGRHVLGSLAGPVGAMRMQLGVENRHEAMQFNAALGRVERDVQGQFLHLTLPLVKPDMHVLGMRKLTALAGVRRDAFSDAQAVIRKHGELNWSITDRLVLDANVAQQYRPPSLFELKLPIIDIPVQVYDPRRDEAVTVMMRSGGNPDLRSTTGKSTNIQASYTGSNGLAASLNYFSIRLWDRIAVLPVPVVLAAETALPRRVGRAAPTAQDIEAGRPGRLTFVDTARDNVGRLFTRGLDFSLAKRFDTAIGALTPRLDLTWIDTFQYSDSPVAGAPLTDRVGLAAEQGTITPWRGVFALGWERGDWEGTTSLRWIPSYHDVGGGSIDAQWLLDFNVSYSPRPHVIFRFGVMDLANTSPHFARIGAATGYDSSQWDPVGRRIMFTVRVSR